MANKVIRIKSGILAGLKAEHRKPQGSGYVNVALLDRKGAYAVGDIVTIGPGEWEWVKPPVGRFHVERKVDGQTFFAYYRGSDVCYYLPNQSQAAVQVGEIEFWKTFKELEKQPA